MARNNLVVNPSFKTDTTGWSATGSSTISRITTDAFFGSSCLQITKAAAVNSGAVIASRIAVTAATSYAVAGYVKVPSGEETGTFQINVSWYTALTGGSLISTTSTIGLESVPGDDWVRLMGVMTAPSLALGASIAVVQPLAGTVGKKVYADAFMFEAASYVGEYFDDVTQAQENKYVNLGLTPLPIPKITGMQLNADVSIGGLILNTIDENGVVWVCTGIDGWWNHPEPEVRDIPRGYGDGSYDVRGRYQARQITLNGVFLVPDPSYVPAARDRLIRETDLVYVGDWLRTNENPTKASYVRLSGRPEISTVNARGRTEFSIGLRASDPLKYEWYENHELGYRSVLIPAQNAGTAATGRGTVTNTGNGYAPVILEVTGPIVGPAYILNETTDELITIISTLRTNITRTVSNKVLTNNIVTLTTTVAHGLQAGDSIVVSAMGSAVFNGTRVILSTPTTTTFTFSSTSANVPSAAASGTITFGPDILQIDTRDHEVSFNGDTVGKRSLIDVLAEWTLLTPGDNVFSFYDEGAVNSTASLSVYYRSAWLG